MKIPKISIIMTVYNGSQYIKDSIESVLNQTYQDFELIIINDHSTDNSLKLMKKYGLNDKRIKIIDNKKNLGPAGSRNKGLTIARGKYIAIQDCDDISLSKRLELEFNFLENNKDIFLVGCDAIKFDENGHETGKIKTIKNPIILLRKIEKQNPIIHSTIMFRNEKKYKYREKMRFSQDYDFYLNCITNGEKLTNINETLIKYRTHSQSISFSKKTKQNLFAEKAKEFYYQRKKFGHDEYNKFDSNEILNLDVEKSIDKKILQYEIKSKFQSNNLFEARIVIKKYFKNYGLLSNPKIIAYFIITFFGKPILKFIKKIKALF